ncbi:hypothetical protein BKA58DRAFT_465687 [Alternaria rosae]|uniref:uncharacterized protein n=1 Tax=Alternaria rosae TaxID=1187941 RepID=UPI001E8DAE7C|nr:uncharacterized protein BKA58DRAFT_465687 [Alternaria rosae]KAH6877949.1 hypothetical protein BKA58DRAFT_465687 [Alternaria rosae]
MQARMIDRYIPDRDNAYQRRSDAPRSSSTLSSNLPCRSAPPSSSSHNTRRHSIQHPSLDDTRSDLDKSLPKNFPQPLTCFFWHQNGQCNKRDIDYAYAHHNTGFMASAPVTPLDSSKALAGRNLSNYNKILDSSSTLLLPDIRDRKVAVMNREMELEEQQRMFTWRESVLEGRESALERREVEVEERERLLKWSEAKLARKRKDGKILERRGKRMKEALGRR